MPDDDHKGKKRKMKQDYFGIEKATDEDLSCTRLVAR